MIWTIKEDANGVISIILYMLNIMIRNGVFQILTKSIYMKLESFQAGLSWECVLNKRDSFRKAYDDFDINKVISYDEAKVNELLNNKEIIRNKRKIEASISNSKIFKKITEEYGSFYSYLVTFTKGKTIYEADKTTNDISDAISKDLQSKGMKFVGSVIIYSYLQSIGIIYSHDKDCFLYKKESKR